MACSNCGQALLAVLVMGAGCMPHAAFAQKEAAEKVAKMAGVALPVQISEVITVTGGNVERIHVEAGQEVKVGELLVEIDADRHKYNYERAKLLAESDARMNMALAEVKARQAELDSAEENLRRRRIKQSDYEKVEAMLDLAQAKLDNEEESAAANKLALEYAKSEYEKRMLKADADGVVLNVNAKLGQRLASGAVVVTIGDPYSVQVGIPVPGDVAKSLQPGSVLLLKSAVDDLLYQATVSNIVNDPKKGPVAEFMLEPSSGIFPVQPPMGQYTLEKDALDQDLNQ